MLKRWLQKLNKQRGSATVEAVVGFTGFIFAIFTILSLVNLCRAQMLVSNAMDNAAKELSQYAYFYKMSGLQRFSRDLEDAASVGREDVNSVIGSVDEFYGSVVGAVNDTAEGYTNIANATQEGTLQWSDVETAIDGVSANADNISASVDGMMTQFEAIGDNPMAYMKSLVAIAGSGGLDLVKSHLIAAPLAKMFVRQQFGGKDKADKTLENLGIKDGLDGMNFKMSSMFTKDYPDDICLVVFYEVELLQLFDMEILSAKLSKVSRCRAWLAGDDFQEIVDPTKPAAEATDGDGDGTGESGTDSTAPSTDGTETTDPTESTDPTETTAPAETTNTSTGNWALQHDPSGYYHSKRCEAFQDQFEEEYFIDSYGVGFGFREKPGKTVGYDFDVYAKWEYESYETMGGNVVDPGPDMLKIGVQSSIKEMARQYTKQDGTVQEFSGYTHVVYVPQNMPDDQYNALLGDAEKVKEEMKTMIANDTTGIPKDLQVNIVIVRSGGEYDYNSSEEDYVHIGGVG